MEAQDKDLGSNVFASKKSGQAISREFITKSMNNFKLIGDKQGVVFTSHSFRSGYITQLWRDTSDIYFVQTVIGQAKIETTARYIKKLTPKLTKLLNFNNGYSLALFS